MNTRHLQHQLMRDHYGRNAASLIRLVTSDDHCFDSLIEMTLHGSVTLAARASWIMSLVCERQPYRIRPHLKAIIHLLGQPALTIPVKRHLLRTLQYADIPKRYHARLIDYCFDLLQQTHEPVAVKVFAMTVLANITANVPELRNEVIIVLEDQLPYASAGFRSRASKILKQFNA